jgi:hypothetical protein
MFFIIIGGIVLILFFISIGFFYRIGKPVNASLSDSYYHHAWKKKIVHSPMGNWFELGYYETEADPGTFTVITRDYGKDHQSVYWKGLKQAVDYPTFYLDAERIPKDSVHVYSDLHLEDNLKVIEGADPTTYRLYKEGSSAYYQYWHQDANSFYLDGKKLNVDGKTFVRINSTLALDINHVYAIITKDDKTEVVQKLKRPEGEAQLISENYARIGNIILHSNWKNPFGAVNFNHIDSIQLLNERTLAVNGQLISDGLLVPEVDVVSWQDIGRDHFKDKKSVYFDGIKIEAADPLTFEVVYEAYSKDSQHVFYKEKMLAGASPSSFVYQYNTGIATDGELNFKEGVLLPKTKQ